MPVEIEAHRRGREQSLFQLRETLTLYDLTNTFFEGTGKYNGKAHFSHSREKRTDCPLVTLGLVLDAGGFPKRSGVFDGNVSEAGTLEQDERSGFYCLRSNRLDFNEQALFDIFSMLTTTMKRETAK